MASSAIAAAGSSPPSSQATQSSGHKRHGHHQSSLSDIDAQGSSLASAPSQTGKVGSKLNISA